MSSSNHTLLIAGPTAAGKSALVVQIAQAVDAEIVNADSMQVYGDLRILSARPDEADMAGIPHHLFGVVDAAEACSTALWHEMASKAVSDIWARGKLAIIVGGTGLYFRAALEGLSPIPEIPADLRAEVRALSTAELGARLSEADPEMAAKLHAGDTQRMARALEVMLATGRSLADWQTEKGEGMLAEAEAAGRFAKFVVSMPREKLYDRINRRFDAMIDEGALDEVRALQARGLAADLPALKALGIPPLSRYLAGEVSREEALERSRTETRQYAKRQLTWFRNQFADWPWLESDNEAAVEEILAAIERE